MAAVVIQSQASLLATLTSIVMLQQKEKVKMYQLSHRQIYTDIRVLHIKWLPSTKLKYKNCNNIIYLVNVWTASIQHTAEYGS